MNIEEIRERHQSGGIAKCGYDAKRVDWLISEHDRLEEELRLVKTLRIGDQRARDEQEAKANRLASALSTAQEERDGYRELLYPHNRDTLKDEAYRQGAEAMREAAKAAFHSLIATLHNKETSWNCEESAAFTEARKDAEKVLSELCALPLPERTENRDRFCNGARCDVCCTSGGGGCKAICLHKGGGEDCEPSEPQVERKGGEGEP